MIKLILSFFVLTGLLCSSNYLKNPDVRTNDWADAFVQDSGYLQKNKALEVLRLADLGDTTGYYPKEIFRDDWWSDTLETDTIGKYYKYNEDGMFLVYILGVGYLKVDVKLNTISLEDYVSDFSERCWSSNFDGFMKLGDYFCFKYCGTGSAYSASHIYLFKDLNNQGNSITQMAFSGFPRREIITSDFHLVQDAIKMHYFYEEGDYIEINDSVHEVKITNKVDFYIDYVFQDSMWVATDSTMLKSIDLPY